jgi:peptidoglycan/LPS O-acetylase OafA/YrhL
MSPSPLTLRRESITQTTAAPRVSELDGLRGIAILMVLFFHYTPASGPLFPLAHIFQAGWSGVDLFFVLSGYLITGILLDTVAKPHYYRNFIVRRSLRIFPLYYACLVLYCVLTFLPSPIRWKDFLGPGGAAWYLPYLGNVKAFLQNAWPGAAVLTPLWSLQVEEQYYFSFPLVVWAANRKTLARILAASIVASLALRIALTLTMPNNKMGTYLLMPSRMDALAMGGLLAIARRESPHLLKSRWIPRLTGIAVLAFLVICIFFSEAPWSGPMRTIGYTAIDLAFTGVVAMMLTGRPAWFVAFCRRRFLVWLGVISYGLYLLHIPALMVADHWLVPWFKLAPRGSAEMLITMPLAIGATSLSWLLFESRVLRLKDRFTVRADSFMSSRPE